MDQQQIDEPKRRATRLGVLSVLCLTTFVTISLAQPPIGYYLSSGDELTCNSFWAQQSAGTAYEACGDTAIIRLVTFATGVALCITATALAVWPVASSSRRLARSVAVFASLLLAVVPLAVFALAHLFASTPPGTAD